MSTKYYFVSSMYRWTYAASRMQFEPQASVTAMHPFKYIEDLNKVENSETVLVAWQEITKQEYDLFKKLDL